MQDNTKIDDGKPHDAPDGAMNNDGDPQIVQDGTTVNDEELHREPYGTTVNACGTQFRSGDCLKRCFLVSDMDDFWSVPKFHCSCWQSHLVKCDDHMTAYRSGILSLSTCSLESIQWRAVRIIIHVLTPYKDICLQLDIKFKHLWKRDYLSKKF